MGAQHLGPTDQPRWQLRRVVILWPAHETPLSMEQHMYQTSDIRKGLKVEMDGSPWTIIEFQFVKPGKGTAFTRTKFKNILTGNVVERNIRTGETLAQADVVIHQMQYLYEDDEFLHFMNTEDYSQVAITAQVVGDTKKWLMDEMMVDILFYQGNPVSLEVPNFVILEITHCEPGVKGNTATGSTKSATLSTGAEVQVPLFVEQGTVIKVDTRTGEYVERVR
jgi:elongation factor P